MKFPLLSRLRYLIALALLLPRPADAHVKWFADYDITKPPLPVGEVLDGEFTCFFLASVVLIYAFYWVDRYVYHRGIMEKELRKYTVDNAVSFEIMRWSVCIFFVAVSVYGFTGHAFFLTPELKTDAAWVPWLQLALALCALHKRAVPLIGVGAGVLYVAALCNYGVYHLLDYLIMLGVAYYFLVSQKKGANWVTSRYIVLYATTGLTLLWAAIEKWGYPSWTYPLLQKEPGLLMGLEPHMYMTIAGYVEFNLAFVLLSSASLLSRTISLGLCSVFALAIYKFGMIDAVGHLMIMAILVVLVVRGPTKGRDFLVLKTKSLWTEAYFMTGLYVLAFVLVFISYYGFHYLAYGAK